MSGFVNLHVVSIKMKKVPVQFGLTRWKNFLETYETEMSLGPHNYHVLVYRTLRKLSLHGLVTSTMQY